MGRVSTGASLDRWSRRAFLSATATTAAAVVGSGYGFAPASADARGIMAKALPTRAEIVARYGHTKPKHFGMFLRHMVTRGEHRTASTFDACGGPEGSHYDEKLINTLREHGVPATLFLDARWIAAFPVPAAELAADPLFELGNHGVQHRPLTVRGQAAYGIAGTASAGEAYDEIVHGTDAVAELTGSRTAWLRPGTAWADDVGVAKNLARAHSRSITLGHFNHPEGKTAEGLAKALPKLLDEGRTFVTLTGATS